MRVAPKIELTDEERAALTKLWRSGLTSVRLAQRARIILLADQGLNNKDIAAQLGIGRMQPARWRAGASATCKAASRLSSATCHAARRR